MSNETCIICLYKYWTVKHEYMDKQSFKNTLKKYLILKLKLTYYKMHSLLKFITNLSEISV